MSQPVRQQKTVLVIAEDHQTRARVVECFRSGGYTVITAQDSVELLALVDQQTPHVIVLLVGRPSEVGLEMLQPLRRRRLPELIPVILVSADATVIVRSDSQCPHFVSEQPIALSELLSHVDSLALTP